MKPFLVGVLTVLCSYAARAQSPLLKANAAERLAILQLNIQRHFYDSAAQRYKEFNYRDTGDKKAWAYLWPLCALIQAANEVEAAAPQSSLMGDVLRHVYAYNDPAPPAAGYNSYLPAVLKEDRFYDDNQWIGIACLDAYNRTGNKAYLAEGEKVYRFMMTGFDTVGGGGLYWKEGDPSTKNTCSNGPGVLVALSLYKATKEQGYLDTALLLYNWTKQTLQAPSGVYYDNLKLPSREVDKRVYTYNTGTMLQSAVILYTLTKNKSYLREAQRMAAAAYKQFYLPKKRWPDHHWFNAVLLRGYEALYAVDKNPLYVQAFRTDLERIFETESDAAGLIGKRKKKELIDQAAVLEMTARLMRLQK